MSIRFAIAAAAAAALNQDFSWMLKVRTWYWRTLVHHKWVVRLECVARVAHKSVFGVPFRTFHHKINATKRENQKNCRSIEFLFRCKCVSLCFRFNAHLNYAHDSLHCATERLRRRRKRIAIVVSEREFVCRRRVKFPYPHLAYSILMGRDGGRPRRVVCGEMNSIKRIQNHLHQFHKSFE